MTDTRYLLLRKDRFREVRCKVRCSDRMHEIILTNRGRLVLPAHNIGREQRLIELGGRECRCMEILRLWRGHTSSLFQDACPFHAATNAVPRPLRDAYQRRWSEQTARDHVSRVRLDPYLTPLLERQAKRTVEAVRTALSQCDYKRGKTTHKVEITMCLRGGDHHHLWVTNVRRSDAGIFGTKVETHWQILVPLLWYQRVYQRNLAVVCRQLVLRVLCPEPLRVIAGRQCREYDVELHRAEVVTDVDHLQLKWTREEPCNN